MSQSVQSGSPDQVPRGVTTPDKLPNFTRLQEVALAHRSSTVLFAAAELDVFTAIANGKTTVDQLAEACGAKREPLRLLLEFCVVDGILTSADGHYANTPATDFFLVRGRPSYGGHGLKYAEDLYPVWGGLASLVRTGKPPIDPDTILGDDKEKTRAFVLAMHERARGLGSVLPHGVDFSGRRRLLDVGGGPGTYSMALVRSIPGLNSTVLDLPGVLEVTRELVEKNGFADRVSLMPGNYLTTPFGTGFDAVLLSGMMHRETADTCRMLLRKSYDALDPGGLVVVSDVFFENDEKNSPPFALSFAINMMLTSNEGSTHAKTEMARWLEEAGFGQLTVKPLGAPNPHTLISGRRP